jgi:hypothetical protein
MANLIVCLIVIPWHGLLCLCGSGVQAGKVLTQDATNLLGATS